jgi:hypothetical protein
MGALARPRPAGSEASEFEAHSCQGEACQLNVRVTNAEGVTIGRECTFTMIATGLGGIGAGIAGATGAGRVIKGSH